MADVKKSNQLFYQYLPSLELPITLELSTNDLVPPLSEALSACSFVAIKSDVWEKISKSSPLGHRHLAITGASGLNKSALRLPTLLSSTRSEAITYQQSVYTYRNLNLVLIFSFRSPYWELALLPHDRGTSATTLKLALNRFLGWALYPHALLGVWGTLQNDQVIVANALKRDGSALFLDVMGGRILFGQKILPIRDILKIYRPAALIDASSRRMTREELYAYLVAQTVFLLPEGPNRAVRQLAMTLAQSSLGVRYHPEKDTLFNRELAA